MAIDIQEEAKPDQRCAILTLTPQAFSKLLQLPEGTEIVGIECDLNYRGILKLKIQGAGWKTPLGAAIRHAEPGTVTTDESGRRVIDWHLGSPEVEP